MFLCGDTFIMSEKFYLKLQQTFKLLFIERQTVHDDTLLQKLASLLEEKIVQKNNEAQKITKIIAEAPWFSALTENWKRIDPSVVAFGLSTAGLLTVAPAGKTTLQKNDHLLKMLLDELVADFQNLPGALRFSTISLLSRLLKVTPKENSFQYCKDIPSLVLMGLTDASIFVARAAKDLTVCLLLTSNINASCDVPLQDEALSTDNTLENIAPQITKTIISCLRNYNEEDITSKKLTRTALNIILEVCTSKKPSVDSFFTKLINAALQPFLDLKLKDDVCAQCFSILLAINSYSFENGFPAEWLNVFNLLLHHHSEVTAIKFAMTTSERLHMSEKETPKELKWIFLSPLMYTFGWHPDEFHFESAPECISSWDSTLKALTTDIVKMKQLSQCVLSNLTKLNGCFKEANERIALTKLLLSALYDQKCISNSSKFQNAALDALLSAFDCWGVTWASGLTENDCTQLLQYGISILERTDSSVPVVIKKMKLMQKLLPIFSALTQECNSILEKLAAVLLKSCHEINWEIRDTTFEVLGVIIKLSKDQKFWKCWLKDSGLLKMVFVAFEDPESYIRASSINILAKTSGLLLEYPDLFNCDNTVEFNPVHEFIRALLEDSEAIVRRSASAALLEWIQAGNTKGPQLDQAYKAMVLASKDLDWEVKLSVFGFWSYVLTDLLTVQSGTDQNAIIARLAEIGFCDAIVSLADDEDASVQHETAKIIQKVKNGILQSQEAYLLESPSLDSSVIPVERQKTAPRANSDGLQEAFDSEKFTEKEKLSGIENVLDMTDATFVESIMVSAVSESSKDNARKSIEDLMADHHRAHAWITGPQFIVWLRTIDVDKMLILSSMTRDLYNYKPELLLDDILVGNYESDQENDNAMDCY